MQSKGKTSVMFIVGVVLLSIAIGSCDDIGLNLTNGQTAAYELDGDSTIGDDQDLDNDTTPFLDRVQNMLWQCAGEYFNEVGCAEVGCYIYKNIRTGEEKMGTISYGPVGSNSITPGSSDPEKNGLSGGVWVVTGYFHSHLPVMCVTTGYWRETGPSDADQLWADKHNLPVYTVDYKGSYNSSDKKYYIHYDDSEDSPITRWVTNPRY